MANGNDLSPELKNYATQIAGNLFTQLTGVKKISVDSKTYNDEHSIRNGLQHFVEDQMRLLQDSSGSQHPTLIEENAASANISITGGMPSETLAHYINSARAMADNNNHKFDENLAKQLEIGRADLQMIENSQSVSLRDSASNVEQFYKPAQRRLDFLKGQFQNGILPKELLSKLPDLNADERLSVSEIKQAREAVATFLENDPAISITKNAGGFSGLLGATNQEQNPAWDKASSAFIKEFKTQHPDAARLAERYIEGIKRDGTDNNFIKMKQSHDAQAGSPIHDNDLADLTKLENQKLTEAKYPHQIQPSNKPVPQR